MTLLLALPLAGDALKMKDPTISAAPRHGRQSASVGSMRITYEDYAFDAYLREFGKSYSDPVEYARREENFRAAMGEVKAHNGAQSSYHFGPTIFSDMDAAERKRYLGRKGQRRLGHSPSRANNRERREMPTVTEGAVYKRGAAEKLPWDPMMAANVFLAANVTEMPASVDFKDQMSEVRDQGGCGSCWTFSVVGVLESRVRKQTGKSFDLSEQELVACTPNEDHCGGTGGCEGATEPLAYDYVLHHGLGHDGNYPYDVNKENTCHANAGQANLRVNGKLKAWEARNSLVPAAVKIGGYAVVPENDKEQLMLSVLANGPISIGMDGSTLFFYRSGIYTSCPSGDSVNVNHAVVLVGWGEEHVDEAGGAEERAGSNYENEPWHRAKVRKYWHIRNSWGKWWGEGGYMKLIRSDGMKDEPCGWDQNPQEASECDLDKGGRSKVLSCGHCGMLSGASFPIEVEVDTEQPFIWGVDTGGGGNQAPWEGR